MSHYLRVVFAFCLFFLFPVSLPSQEKPSPSPQVKEEPLPPQLAKELEKADEVGDSRFFQEFINMMFTLGIILGIIIVVMWILKKMLSTRLEQVNKASVIKVLERRSLSPKTTVYILGVFGKAIAIAESTNGVTLLSDLTQPKSKNIAEQTLSDTDLKMTEG